MRGFNIAVLGAGEMGQGGAHFLEKDDLVKSFTCFDNNDLRLWSIKKRLGKKGKTQLLDVTNDKKLLHTLISGKFDGVLNTLPQDLLPKTTMTILIAGLPGVDLGLASEKQKALAEKLGIKIQSPYSRACGTAPGIVTAIPYHRKKELDVCKAISSYAGGILQNPRGKIGHAPLFSVPGIDHEYFNVPKIIKNGEITDSEILEKGPLQTFILPNQKIVKTESAQTADNMELGALLDVPNVVYSCLRHAGFDHFDKARAVKDKTKEERIDWLWRNLIPKEGEEDMMLVRTFTIGLKNGIETAIIDELICFYNEMHLLSAMMQMTMLPAVETLLQMLCASHLWRPGFANQEEHIHMPTLKKKLLDNGVILKKTIFPDLS